MSEQLTLDLYQTSDATSDFRAWLLSFPPTPWANAAPAKPKPVGRRLEQYRRRQTT